MGSMGIDYSDAEIQSFIGRKDLFPELGNDDQNRANPRENDTIDSGERKWRNLGLRISSGDNLADKT